MLVPMCLTLFPGYVGGKKIVWYPLLAHAQPYFSKSNCVVYGNEATMPGEWKTTAHVDPPQIISVRIVRPVCMLYNNTVAHQPRCFYLASTKNSLEKQPVWLPSVPGPPSFFSFAVQKSCDLQYEKNNKKIVLHVYFDTQT